MKEFSNQTESNLHRLAIKLGCPAGFGWKSRLADALKIKRNTISTWIRRNHIPHNSLKTIEASGHPAHEWCFANSGKSGPQSTISGRPLASYEQEPELMAPSRHGAVEGEGLHGQTQQINIGGHRVAVTTLSPDPAPPWSHW